MDFAQVFYACTADVIRLLALQTAALKVGNSMARPPKPAANIAYIIQFILRIRRLNSSLSLTCGNGVSGIGFPRNLQSGAHPSLT